MLIFQDLRDPVADFRFVPTEHIVTQSSEFRVQLLEFRVISKKSSQIQETTTLGCHRHHHYFFDHNFFEASLRYSLHS